MALTPLSTSPRSSSSFDDDWLFSRSEDQNPEAIAFDDRAWRRLSVPHDWSIEGPFEEKNPTGGAGGFLPSGVGWYRKHFTLSAAAESQRVFVAFDGVMENSRVWINGTFLGERPSGYVSFRYDLTPHVRFGTAQENVIAVRVDTSAQPASRWYTGAGIYRHVRLIVCHAVHLEAWATFISTPKIAAEFATVRVQARANNQSAKVRSISLHVTLRSPDGEIAAAAETPIHFLPANQNCDFTHDLTLPHPLLWNLDAPRLYQATVSLCDEGAALDAETVTFGLRDARFEAASGFWLNNRNLKIKGVCLHHDGGAFGAAVPLTIWAHRLTALKSLGVNAIRTAHNPPSPEFLDLCDRMGFLVVDELFDCWTVGKNPHDFHRHFTAWSERDLRDTVRRDRNHPSIILYSAGNEIHDTPQEKMAFGILTKLVAAFHEEDPTRPVTQALFRPNVSHDYDHGLADLLDVIGTNYRDLELLAAHAAKPSRKILGTEQSHERGVWLRCRDNPPHSGQFLWCGIDYLGESRAWPNVAAASGLLDKTGGVKSMALERAALWCVQPVVHVVRRTGRWEFAPTDPGFTPLDRKQVLFADWTPRDSSAHEETVEVYSNAEEVELVLNDHSLGTQTRAIDDAPRIWSVIYAPGILRAISRNAGAIVATAELRTAGTPVRIALSCARKIISPGWDEVAVITAVVVDAQGVRVPDATPPISFSIQGAGAVVAVDTEDIASHEPFQTNVRHAYQGQCVAFVRATAAGGPIHLRASAAGMVDGALELSVVGTDRVR